MVGLIAILLLRRRDTCRLVALRFEPLKEALIVSLRDIMYM